VWLKMEVIYASLLLNKLGREINQQNITDVLKAADAPYEIETVIKVVDGLNGVDVKEVLSRGYIMPIKEEPEPEPVVEEEDDPIGLLKLFG